MACSFRYKVLAIAILTTAIVLQFSVWRLLRQVTPSGMGVHKRKTEVNLTCDRGFNLKGYSKENRNEDLIIYTEVPKCASTTFMQILSNACDSSKKYSTHYTKPLVIQNLLKVTDLSRRQKFVKTQVLPFTKKPYIFRGHLGFFDFNELGYKQPLFIDLVRDPVERWISLYYYQTSNSALRKRLKLSPDEIKQTLGYCLQFWIRQTNCEGRDVKETAACLNTRPFSGCKGAHIKPIYPEWFSGKYMDINTSMVSIERAKTNIEKYYTFIGITEHFKETLVAMETILPRFKNELSVAYKQKKEKRENVGRNKVRPNNASIAVMKEVLADDYDLYKFILQRFYIHMTCLGVHVGQ
ncbi:unnamed protein product [Owenia fusiformis]|uniref:Uncharacterized protein n=1 Tax=Owenia fusiformis TaxID=6347 RepID=A0A8J1TNH9_OWEFU|nr:unnamed protein product [Owenia fusiformis]